MQHDSETGRVNDTSFIITSVQNPSTENIKGSEEMFVTIKMFPAFWHLINQDI